MKIRSGCSILTLVLGLVALDHVAAGKGGTQGRSQDDHEGQGMFRKGGDQSSDDSQPSQKIYEMSKEQKKAARTQLSSSSIALTTDLKSALNRVEGLKAQLKEQPDPAALTQNTAKVQQAMNGAKKDGKEFRAKAQGIPILPNTVEYNDAAVAVTDVRSQHDIWNAKAAEPGYWSNKEQASRDLDGLENALKSAIDKTHHLNKSLKIKDSA